MEIGKTFIVWAWDPVEDATGYEAHAYPDGTPPNERPPLLVTVEPTFRADGLEPEAVMELFVRAIRETAGGRAEGPWSDPGFGETPGEPRVCTDERQHARAFGAEADWGPPVLIDEWDGTPFRFYFDAGIPESERADAEHFFEVVERLSERIEDQLGYSVLEVAGWIGEDERGFVIRDDNVRACKGARPGGSSSL